MVNKKKLAVFVAVGAAASMVGYKMEKLIKEKSTEKGIEDSLLHLHKKGFYEKYIKRPLDIICALLAIICFCWLYAIIAILVKIKLGSPVIFKQMRPGLNEKIFPLYKFRTMTDEQDENGELLPDEMRLIKFGKWLRSTSLDELPEAFNILNGTMSVIGPRPQLVRDMVFMTDRQRMRHTVKPGLSGLAQVNGRNGISWEEKLDWDLKYIEKITFLGDVKIIIDTVGKAFMKKEGVVREGTASDMDFGDWLLSEGAVSKEEYDENQEKARSILGGEDEKGEDGLVSIIMPSYNTAPFIRQAIQSVLEQTYENWELLIVDDCSTDNTCNIISDIQDERIHLFKNERNSGAAVSRNWALREARGRWIAFLDSDDLWEPEKLEKQLTFMEKNGYSFSYTGYQIISETGEETGKQVTGPKKISKKGMFNYCWPGCLTVIYDRNMVGLIQVADIRKNNDYAMWLKVCQKADCYLLDECLARYRRGRSGSISTQGYFELMKWHFKLFREAEKEDVVLSLFNTARNVVFGLYKKTRYVMR